MKVTTEEIKKLRNKTGISIMQCKKALEESKGDSEKAIVILRKKGSAIAEKKAERELNSGSVQAYVHGTGDVGAMVELQCETDFVAKNKEFIALAYDIAMHVAAVDPEFATMDDITAEARKTAMEVFEKETEGKPKDLKEKILAGKLDTYFSDKVLLEQNFIKQPDDTIKDLIEAAIQKFGERIEVTAFVRFSVR